ncbi:hypothetical protein [Haloferax elongans]|uniref:hypothetical protein n=1 Tax=Haloferax elongans TaxID=403191 RepID=UPI00067808A0|nr:hypothetical protein [Haloferax elongans]
MTSTSSGGVAITFWTVAAATMLVGLAVEIPAALSGKPNWALLVALAAGLVTVVLHRYPHLDVELLDLS